MQLYSIKPLCRHFESNIKKKCTWSSSKKLVLWYVNIFMNHYVDKNMLKLQCHLYEFAARRNKCKILRQHKTNTIVCSTKVYAS